MAKLRKVIAVVLVIGLFAAGIFLGVGVSRRFGLGATEQRFNTPALLKEIQTLSELVTVKYVIEKVEVWTDPPQTLLGQFFAGDNHILLLAHGIVKAGVDLSEIKPEDLQVVDKKLVIRLPAPQITDAYLDDKETKVIERTTGFLRAFDKDLEQNIRRIAVQDIRNAAARGGILKDADERARTQLKNFLKQMGFEEVEFRAPEKPEVVLPAS